MSTSELSLNSLRAHVFFVALQRTPSTKGEIWWNIAKHFFPFLPIPATLVIPVPSVSFPASRRLPAPFTSVFPSHPPPTFGEITFGVLLIFVGRRVFDRQREWNRTGHHLLQQWMSRRVRVSSSRIPHEQQRAHSEPAITFDSISAGHPTPWASPPWSQ